MAEGDADGGTDAEGDADCGKGRIQPAYGGSTTPRSAPPADAAYTSTASVALGGTRHRPHVVVAYSAKPPLSLRPVMEATAPPPLPKVTLDDALHALASEASARA